MKATGIVRRVGDLGHIVIPKGIRRNVLQDLNDLFRATIINIDSYENKVPIGHLYNSLHETGPHSIVPWSCCSRWTAHWVPGRIF